MADRPLFASFFAGGFECSTHRRLDGRRLDVIAATAHDRLALDDYRLLSSLGLRTVRDGFRWHRIESAPHVYDWSSVLPQIRAARRAGVQVLWDLMHYGWPDGLDIESPAFVDRFARFAGAAARVLRDEGVTAPVICPINEISFFSWASAEFGIFEPFRLGQGAEMKAQLVRAAVAAMDAIRRVSPEARFLHVDPVIRVQPDPDRDGTAELAAAIQGAQFEAWDMISGRLRPELGGAPEFLDVVGINYYCHNQWVVDGPPIPWNAGDPRFVGLRELIADVATRYGRPVYVAETGIEDDLRPSWFAYVCEEIRAAQDAGHRVEGVCLYPVLNHPGWDDDRHCRNGLLDYDRSTFARRVEEPLADELLRQHALFGLEPPYRRALAA